MTCIYERIDSIDHFLFSVRCPTVEVMGRQGHFMGRYFYFNEEDINKMVGNGDWNGEKFDVVQKRWSWTIDNRWERRKIWSGQVVLWKAKKYYFDPDGVGHGRRYPKNESKVFQFAPSDSIELKSCVDESKNY